MAFSATAAGLRNYVVFVFFSSQNTRDLNADRKAGHMTLATLVGPQSSCYVHTLLLLFPYVVTAVLASRTSLYFCIPMITIPYALNLGVACFEGEHSTLPHNIAMLDSAFGILFVISVFLK